MTDQNGVAARGSPLDNARQRVQPARKHQYAIWLMEGPVVLILKLEVGRLRLAVRLKRHELERIPIIREKTENLLHYAFHGRGFPELGLSDSDQIRSVSAIGSVNRGHSTSAPCLNKASRGCHILYHTVLCLPNADKISPVIPPTLEERMCGSRVGVVENNEAASIRRNPNDEECGEGG